MEDRMDHASWRERAWILPLAGAVMGCLFYMLVGNDRAFYDMNADPIRQAAGTTVAVSGVVFALTVERLRWVWSVVFALIAGLVSGLIFYWSGAPDGYSSDGWHQVSILVAIAMAAPLFQAFRDQARWPGDYRAVHAYAWSNVVLWFASLAFVGATLLLTLLLGELFNLIGIRFLRDLLQHGWFVWMLIGAAIGAAAAMLRERDRIMDLLQGLVMVILSVLAVPLALGLALFVIALPFTGLQPLWDQTRATTPTVLACIVGAVLLANAVIRNAPGEEAENRVLRWSALLLAIVQLPLALVALASTWQRIDQYGFTPERLWGLVFVGVSLLVAAAYMLSVILGRANWMQSVRETNVRLAVAVCLLAVLLATPILDFGAISTRDQIARLRDGKTSPDRFDWAALAFDFGPSGRRALEKMAATGSAQAKEALAARSRWHLNGSLVRDVAADEGLKRRLVVRPAPAEVPDNLRAALIGATRASTGVCVGEGRCELIWRPGERIAVAIKDECPMPDAADNAPGGCDLRIATLVEEGGEWRDTAAAPEPVVTAADRAAQRRAIASGQVEIRDVTRKQLFIGGRPVGQPFE